MHTCAQNGLPIMVEFQPFSQMLYGLFSQPLSLVSTHSLSQAFCATAGRKGSVRTCDAIKSSTVGPHGS